MSSELILRFGQRKLQCRVERGERRHIRITVEPDLTIHVRAPRTIGSDQVRALVAKRAAWIARALEKQERYHPLPSPKNYISGETFVYLGRQYRLKVVAGADKPAKLQGPFLFVHVKNAGKEQVRRKVENWYRDRAGEAFARHLLRCHAIAGRHGVPLPHISIRTLKRRWGSCSAAGHITLNVKLVQVPVQCLEYVIMHELCHLRQHNHGREFFSLLTRCQPDWRTRKEILAALRFANM